VLKKKGETLEKKKERKRRKRKEGKKKWEGVRG
jgi:hypothetical protein